VDDFQSRNYARFASLSEREHDVLDLIVAGAINREIAVALGLSQRTVEVHRRNISQRLGRPRVVDLVLMAAEAYYMAERSVSGR